MKTTTYPGDGKHLVETVKIDLIRQAAKLLEAIPDYINPYIIEVYFDNNKERIEIWNMLADEERMLAYVEYDV